jgi:FSR family fosmidomycin resistance protein-like MFS transporter
VLSFFPDHISPTAIIPMKKSGSETKLSNQIITIAGGHLFHDMYPAFLAPLLPTIINNLALSLTSAGLLTSFSRLPSIFHPLAGYLADKKGAKYFVIVTPAITATLMSLLGLASSFFSLAVLLLFAGFSSTLFHASSPGMVASAGNDRKGFALSLFMAGGGIGRSLGPLVVVWAVTSWGLNNTFRLMVFGWVMSLILYFQLKDMDNPTVPGGSFKANLPAFRNFFIPLAVILILRSFLTATLTTYLPVYVVTTGAPLWMAGAAISALEIAGVTGALIAGPLSDSFGRRKLIRISMLISALTVPVFLSVDNWIILPLLIVLGFFNLSTVTLFLTLVQDTFPEQRATSNSFYLLISFLSNGLMIILIGFIGDTLGLPMAYMIGAGLTLLAIPALQLLPPSAS